MADYQAPPSLGFSRQEHWSGLPFPSPMHESEKWKWSCSVVSDSLRPHGLQPTRLLCPWDFPGKNTRAGCHFLLQGIFPTRGSNRQFLHLLHWQVYSLLLENPKVYLWPGKPKSSHPTLSFPVEHGNKYSLPHESIIYHWERIDSLLGPLPNRKLLMLYPTYPLSLLNFIKLKPHINNKIYHSTLSLIPGTKWGF